MEPVIRELIERSAADTRRHIDELKAQVARGLKILDSELPKLRTEIEQLRQDMQGSIEEATTESRHCNVLVEEMRDQLKFVAEGHGGLDSRLSSIQDNLSGFDERLSALDMKVTSLETRTERGLGGVQKEVVHLRADLADLRHELAQMRR